MSTDKLLNISDDVRPYIVPILTISRLPPCTLMETSVGVQSLGHLGPQYEFSNAALCKFHP